MPKYVTPGSFSAYEFLTKRLNILKHIERCQDAADAAYKDVCNKRKIIKHLLEKIIEVSQMIREYLCWYMRFCNEHAPETVYTTHFEIISLDIPLSTFHEKTVPVGHNLNDYIMKLTAHQTALNIILRTALNAKCLDDLTNLEMPDIFDASDIAEDLPDLESEWDNLRLHQRLSLLLDELKYNLISEAETEE